MPPVSPSGSATESIRHNYYKGSIVSAVFYIIDAGPFMPDEDEDEGTPFGQDNKFGTSTTAKGLFDASDEEKESSGAFAAAISGKKSTEEPSEDADNESLQSSSK